MGTNPSAVASAVAAAASLPYDAVRRGEPFRGSLDGTETALALANSLSPVDEQVRAIFHQPYSILFRKAVWKRFFQLVFHSLKNVSLPLCCVFCEKNRNRKQRLSALTRCFNYYCRNKYFKNLAIL